jgi:lysophospholipase L1-like esterase
MNDGTTRRKWVFLLALLVPGVAAEGYVRVIIEKQLARHSATLSPIVRRDPNPDVLYGFIPGATADHGRIEINLNGYRDSEFPTAETREGLFLILTLGDSVTFGGRVQLEEVYSKRLEQRLNARAGPRRVRVLNAGVPGYNTQQELAVLRQLGPQFSPNLIVLGWVLNDADPAYNIYEGESILRQMYPLRSFSDVSVRTLLHQSRLLILLKEQVKTFQLRFPQLVPESIFYLNSRVQRAEWQRMKEALLEIASFAQSYRAELMVVLFPYEVQLRRGTTLPQDDVAQFLRTHGIRVLDVFPALSAHKDKTLFVEDGIHLTSIGHQIVAEDIFNALAALRSVPESQSTAQAR